MLYHSHREANYDRILHAFDDLDIYHTHLVFAELTGQAELPTLRYQAMMPGSVYLGSPIKGIGNGGKWDT